MPVLSSGKLSVTIGIGEPLVIIGERINPTGKPKFAQAFKKGDFSQAVAEAVCQVEAGAQVLDINAGVPGINEPRTLSELVSLVSRAVEVPLCIDTSNFEALEAALGQYQGKALVNSVNAKSKSLERVLPLVAEHGAAVIGLTLTDEGIPKNLDGRLKAAEMIIKRAEAIGIDKEDILIDPLALSVGTDHEAAKTALLAVRRLTEEFGCCTVLGLSNISFGLPERSAINEAFLTMAVAEGLAAAIADPVASEIRKAVASSALLAGRDPHAKRYLMWYKSERR